MGHCSRFSQFKSLDLFFGKVLCQKINCRLVGAGSYLVRVIGLGIGTNEQMITPRHHISSFHMHFFRAHLVMLSRDMSYKAFERFKLFFSQRQNVGPEKGLANHKANVTRKNLVAIF